MGPYLSRADLLLEKDDLVFTVVSRLRRFKNIGFLIRAMRVVHRKSPRARLLIVGDGPDRKALESLAREAVPHGVVRFLGFHPAPQAIVRLSDVFVSASLSEGMSNALIEAAMTGTPALASSRAAGSREVVSEGDTGLLHDPEKPEQFIAAATRLISDPGLRQRMGRSARARYEALSLSTDRSICSIITTGMLTHRLWCPGLSSLKRSMPHYVVNIPRFDSPLPDKRPGRLVKRLTTQEYWDGIHSERHSVAALPSGREGFLRRLVRRVAGRRVRHFADHADHVIETLLRSHLPRDPSWSVLEVGSAPGRRLLRFREWFGYRPVGVEYSEWGVRETRELFVEHGLPESVRPADSGFGSESGRHWFVHIRLPPRPSPGPVAAGRASFHYRRAGAVLACYRPLGGCRGFSLGGRGREAPGAGRAGTGYVVSPRLGFRCFDHDEDRAYLAGTGAFLICFRWTGGVGSEARAAIIAIWALPWEDSRSLSRRYMGEVPPMPTDPGKSIVPYRSVEQSCKRAILDCIQSRNGARSGGP